VDFVDSSPGRRSGQLAVDNDETVIHRAALCPQTPQTSIGYDKEFKVKTDRPDFSPIEID
jgi:hypothetical protein